MATQDSDHSTPSQDPGPSSDVAFTPTVKAIQERLGSRRGYAAMEQRGGWQTRITEDLRGFIKARDSFYLATSNAAGQPYIQHRGGPAGFLKVLDERTLAFADYSGNKQYISMGNLEDNAQAFLFLMDYPNRRRIKLWGTADVVEDDPDLLQQLADPEYRATPERVIRFRVSAWDVNCPQHITQRFSAAELAPTIQRLEGEIAALKQENAALQARLAATPPPAGP